MIPNYIISWFQFGYGVIVKSGSKEGSKEGSKKGSTDSEKV